MAKVIAAELTLNSQQANQSVGSFKKQLREAQLDVITLSEKFGATSEQALNAAQRAAELKDQIGDAKTLVDAFNPDKKFNGFAAALGAVTGGFTAIQGAMGLLGVESEDLQKQLLKVQSAMAFSQGLNMFGDAIQSVKTFGTQLVANLGRNGLIGVAIAGVGLLVASLTGLFDGTKKINAAQKAYNDTTKDYKNAAADAIQKVTEVRIAFDLAKKGLISKGEALKQYNETLGDSLGHTKSLATAEKNLADKADVYIKVTALKAQANALFAISAQKSADALVLQNDVIDKIGKGGGRFVQDLKKQIEDNKKSLEQGSKDIEKLGEGLIRQAAILAKTGKVSFTGDKPDKKTDPKEDPRIQAEKDALAEIKRMREENFTRAIADETMRQKAELNIQFVNDYEKVKASKASRESKNALIKELEIKLLADIADIDKKAAEEKEKLEKIALDRLKKVTEENNQTALQLKNDALKAQIELEYEASDKSIDAARKRADAIFEIEEQEMFEKAARVYNAAALEIEAMQASEQTKTDLLLAAREARDNAIAEYDADRVEKQLEVKAQLDLAELNDFERKNKALDDNFKKQFEIVRGNAAAEAQLIEQYEKAKTRIKEAETLIQINNLADSIGLIANLLGKASVAGKALALAQIATNTAVAYIQGLRIAQESAKGTGPAAAFAFPIFYATQVAAIIGAVAKAKSILGSNNVSTSGFSIPQVSTSSVSAPLQPTPQVTTTALDASTLGAIGNSTVRAFIFESDVTNNRERITRLNRQARLGG